MRHTPSEKELENVRKAYAEADPFMYSPTFFHRRSTTFKQRVERMVAPPSCHPHPKNLVGQDDLGYEYYETGGEDRLQTFVALYFKGLLHVSDVVPIFRDPDDWVLSKGMFRPSEQAQSLTISQETLFRLVDELMILALLTNVHDHRVSMEKESGGWKCRYPWVVNISFSLGEEYALYDFETYDHNYAFPSELFLTEDSGIFSDPEIDWLGFLKKHFQFERSGLRELLMKTHEHYSSEDGYRLFRAICLRSKIMRRKKHALRIRTFHARMLETVRYYIDGIDRGVLYPRLRQLLDIAEKRKAA